MKRTTVRVDLTERFKEMGSKMFIHPLSPGMKAYFEEKIKEEQEAVRQQLLGGTHAGRPDDIPVTMLSAEQMADISARLWESIKKHKRKAGKSKGRKPKDKTSS